MTKCSIFLFIAKHAVEIKPRDLVRGRNHVLFFGDFNTGYIDWERLVNSDRRTAPRAQSIMELMGDLGFTREWVREPTREDKASLPIQHRRD
ncbi:unnamed protein product, partial [Mesorhabditis spiculigera]